MCIWVFIDCHHLSRHTEWQLVAKLMRFTSGALVVPQGACLFGSRMILDLCVGSCSKRHRLCCGFQRTMAPCLTPNSYFMSELKQADSLRVVFREKQGGVSHILLRSRQQFVCDIVLDFSHSVPLSSPHSCCFDVE